MKYTDLKALYRDTQAYAGKEVIVAGWVRTNRGSNKFGFIELNDGTFFKSVQIVYEEETMENFAEISKYPIASALVVSGQLVPDA